MEKYDAVIVGAGLAGLQCARLLGRDGLRVLLVDRKPAVDSSIHTTGIFVRRTLEDFDLPEDCLGAAINNVTLYSPARRSMTLHSDLPEFRIGRMGPLYQRFLGQCLNAGVEWSPDTSYMGSEPVADGSRVHLEAKKKSRYVDTRFLIGADGANSRVARDLHLDLNREWIVGVEDVLADVALNGPPQLHCFLDPALAPGYLAWVAHDGVETHVGVGGYSEKFSPVIALENFRSSLEPLFRLRNATRIERRGGRIPVGGVLRRIVNDRGLLIGDAAGAVSPLTAGGLDPCMRLSTLAADLIVQYCRSGDLQLFRSYSGESFRARFASRIWMRRIIANLTNRPLLEFGCALIRAPVLNAFAWHIFFGRGSFPDVSAAHRRGELPVAT